MFQLWLAFIHGHQHKCTLRLCVHELFLLKSVHGTYNFPGLYQNHLVWKYRRLLSPHIELSVWQVRKLWPKVIRHQRSGLRSKKWSPTLSRRKVNFGTHSFQSRSVLTALSEMFFLLQWQKNLWWRPYYPDLYHKGHWTIEALMKLTSKVSFCRDCKKFSDFAEPV